MTETGNIKKALAHAVTKVQNAKNEKVANKHKKNNHSNDTHNKYNDDDDDDNDENARLKKPIDDEIRLLKYGQKAIFDSEFEQVI